MAAANTLLNVGDQVLFKTTPIFNLTSLTSCTFQTTNVNNSGGTHAATMSTVFRYTLDGVLWTEWEDFVSSAAFVATCNASIQSDTVLAIQFIFTRTGPADLSSIIINGVTINGTYNSNLPTFPVATKTPMGRYAYDDVDVYNLAINLTQKCYDIGIVPTYLVRGEDVNDLYTDEDFVSLWFTISKLYAALLSQATELTMIYWRRELLLEYLLQRNLLLSGNEDLPTLQLIASQFFDQFRQRGTIEIFRRKSYEYPLGSRRRYALAATPSGGGYVWNATLFILTPTNPVWIDGQKFVYEKDLPFGWVLRQYAGAGAIPNSIYLISPDNNHHVVEIIDNSTLPVITPSFDYSIIDTLPKIPITYIQTANPEHFTGVYKKLDGEYLRIIEYDVEADEFIFNNVNPQNKGWTLGHSSPLYKGLRQHNNTSIIKGYENFTSEVWDLLYYPIIGSGVDEDSNLILVDDNELLLHDPAVDDFVPHV